MNLITISVAICVILVVISMIFLVVYLLNIYAKAQSEARARAEPPADPDLIQDILERQYPAPPGANFEQWMDECIQAYPEDPEMVLAMWEKRMLDAGYEFADEVEDGYSALVWKNEGRAHIIKYRITTQETDPHA